MAMNPNSALQELDGILGMLPPGFDNLKTNIRKTAEAVIDADLAQNPGTLHRNELNRLLCALPYGYEGVGTKIKNLMEGGCSFQTQALRKSA